MAHSHRNNKDRRNFLKLSAKLAALGVTSLGTGLGTERVFASESRTTAGLTDYKALVCIYLFGGNDANNLIVPVDTASYAAYQTLRGGLALTGTGLLAPIADAAGRPYALHSGLSELNPYYGTGQLAVVLNMGQLDRPLTRTQYLEGNSAPSNLFSHSDQTNAAQTATSDSSGLGWGGRLLDCCGQPDNLAAVSMSSPALFLQGFQVSGNVITPGVTLGLSGITASSAPTRRQALNQIFALDGGNTVRRAANQAMTEGLVFAEALAATNTSPSGTLVFPNTTLGNQLREVARLIRVRSAQGPGRQVFFCSISGFDTHASQTGTQTTLLQQLSGGMAAFQRAMEDSLLSNQVTAFTQSEFCRTLQSNGTGSDHAWGSHQMVLGGAVKGGIYGEMPVMALGGPDDANTRGVWIPKIATTQFGATLGKWYGATPANLLYAFPGIENFPTTDVGFMR
jgi:uncharacterized protein (DUF1501 family)